MIRAVAQTSKEQVVDFLQAAGALSAVVGTVTSVALAILGQDYKYPYAVAVLGACMSFSIWMTKCAKEEVVINQKITSTQMTSQEVLEHQFAASIDALGVSVKDKLKRGKNAAIDLSITSAKIATLPLGDTLSRVAGVSLDLAGQGVKGISDVSIDGSVNLTGKMIGKSTSKSLKPLFS